VKNAAFISTVVYVHNNAETLDDLVVPLDHILASSFENYEILVVNDASTDRSAQRIAEIADRTKQQLTVVNLAWRHGAEKGVLAGVDLAIGDFVVEIDAGKFDYGLAVITQLFDEASAGYDVVAATPFKGGAGDGMFFNFFNRVSYLSFDVRYETVRIVSRRAINALFDLNERVVHRGILYQWSGFPKKTIHYEPSKGARATTRVPLTEKLALAFDVIVSYSHVGSNVSVLLAVLFLLASLLLGLYALVLYITVSGIVPGWTTTMLFLSLGFSGTFMVLALQGRYISSLLVETKGRPQYTVRSVERYPKENGESG
jgi:polyisoprenyl-phosphate glycosyltransferase